MAKKVFGKFYTVILIQTKCVLCWYRKTSLLIKRKLYFLEMVITCNESWCFNYNPETKHQSMHWKSPSSQSKKRHGCASQNSKPWWLCFLGSKGSFTLMRDQFNWRSVCKANIVEVLTSLYEHMRKKRHIEISLVDSSLRQFTGAQHTIDQYVFDQAWNSCVRVSTLLIQLCFL